MEFMSDSTMRNNVTCGMSFLACITLLTGYVLMPASVEVVEYEVVFEATWSQTNHPQDFPLGPHCPDLLVGHTGMTILTLLLACAGKIYF